MVVDAGGKKDPRLGGVLGIGGPVHLEKGEGAQLALGIWFPTLCGECGATNQVGSRVVVPMG